MATRRNANQDMPGGSLPVSDQILQAIIDAFKNLPPQYRVPVLFFFMFFLMFLASLPFKDKNLPWGVLLACIIVAVIFMLIPRQGSDPGLAKEQYLRRDLILPPASLTEGPPS